MKKSLFTFLFAALTVMGFAQSTQSQTHSEENLQIEIAENQGVSRGASNVENVMAKEHQAAVQKFQAAVAFIQEDEDTEVFNSESAQDTGF